MIPGFTQWVKDPAESCSVSHRCGSDPVLLWLWRRSAAAAPIRSLAWGLPYGADAAARREREKKERRKERKGKEKLISGEKKRISVKFPYREKSSKSSSFQSGKAHTVTRG